MSDKQDSPISVNIPKGYHGEVSQHLSETIGSIRKKPVYRTEMYFEPSTLLAAIQSKSVAS